MCHVGGLHFTDIVLNFLICPGYFVCTAEWFRQYTYEVIVPRKLAPPEAIKILEGGNPVVLPPWVSRCKTFSIHVQPADHQAYAYPLYRPPWLLELELDEFEEARLDRCFRLMFLSSHILVSSVHASCSCYLMYRKDILSEVGAVPAS